MKLKILTIVMLVVFTTGCTSREIGLSIVGAATLVAAAFVVDDYVDRKDSPPPKHDEKPDKKHETKNDKKQSSKNDKKNDKKSNKENDKNQKQDKKINAKNSKSGSSSVQEKEEDLYLHKNDKRI